MPFLDRLRERTEVDIILFRGELQSRERVDGNACTLGRITERISRFEALLGECAERYGEAGDTRSTRKRADATSECG